MPRKGSSPQREVGPDPIYQNVMVHRLINKVMSGQDPDKVLEKALGNVMPLLEVRPRRVGGATYQVPVEVRPERRMSLGLRWLVDYARQRKDKRTMLERLVAEILDASNGQ